MADSKFTPVEPDDPRRCQAVHGNGQCRYQAVDGSKYCPMHGGNKGLTAQVAAIKRQYQLAKWQTTVDAFADEDQVKSLRGEIGIARMLLETVLVKCKDQSDLLLYSAKIGDMIGRVEKLVVSCHRLESNLGLLLDKSKVLALATQIVEIISTHVKDDDAIAGIAGDIVNAIVAAQGRAPND